MVGLEEAKIVCPLVWCDSVPKWAVRESGTAQVLKGDRKHACPFPLPRPSKEFGAQQD